MPLFDFTGPAAISTAVAITNTGTTDSALLNFTDGGVNFTLSFTVTNIAPAPQFVAVTARQASGAGNVFVSANPGVASNLFNVTMTLDVANGVGFTQFLSPVISVSAIGGMPAASWNIQFLGAGTAGFALASGANSVAGGGSQQVTAIQFTASNISGGQVLELNSLNATINCFCTDTRIATPTGPRAVQDLVPGDVINTTSSGTTQVKWLGIQPVDVHLSHPDKVNPIRISAGALGNGLPERDLLISADHAIALDGHLINASALVNGVTIYREPKMPMGGFTYYHIETEAHELLLAEGVAAESFIDYAGRGSFENGAEATAQIIEMDLPRISSARMVPEHIQQRLTPAIAAQ